MREEPFDLLKVPWIGPVLRRPGARLVAQTVTGLIALLMILHGLLGPELAPKNLATLLTWVHFRGLVVLILLVAGNFFCYACPMMLPRELARRMVKPRWRWPRRLRSKWVAIALFAGVLFSYELLDLWSDPRGTALLVLGYFAAALLVDAFFQRASFCKFFCPLGQFNFLASTISPLEVAVKDPAACDSCRTADCIRGRGALRGCEMDLFQPSKVGNLDCTFCLDCVVACPVDNVGILARVPAESLARDGPRSGTGRISRRADWTALIVVFTAGALLNALAMIRPVQDLARRLADVTGVTGEGPILLLLFVLCLVLAPAILLGIAAAACRKPGALRLSLRDLVSRFAPSLVPFGTGMWLAHYGFHFFTGFLTVIPVVQLAAAPWLGRPRWDLGGLPEAAVFPMELGFLGLGLLGSMMVSGRIAADLAPAAPGRVAAPWVLLHLALAALAIWILGQPMDMRGTFLGS